MKKILGLVLALLMLMTVSAFAIEVFPDADSPTGYSVTFTYDDPDAYAVNMYVEFKFIDPADSSVVYPTTEWTPNLVNAGGSTYALTKGEDGIWSITMPTPSGLYGYRFEVISEEGAAAVMTWDPTNRPINNDEVMRDDQRGDYYLSTFFAPFDAEKQVIDYSVQGPRDDEFQGSIEFLEFEESKYPISLYKPYNYDVNRAEPYKLFILFHGGGGFYANWLNNGAAANIADNLIAEGKFDDDTLILMPQLSLSDDVAKTLVEVVMPYLYENYNVSDAAADHAFSGLSAGGAQTSRTFATQVDAFKYFHWMSGCGLSNTITAKQAMDYRAKDLVLRFSCNPLDMAYGDVIGNVEIFTELGYEVTFTDLGTAHCWHTWRLHLADYLENYLWK